MPLASRLPVLVYMCVYWCGGREWMRKWNIERKCTCVNIWISKCLYVCVYHTHTYKHACTKNRTDTNTFIDHCVWCLLVRVRVLICVVVCCVCMHVLPLLQQYQSWQTTY